MEVRFFWAQSNGRYYPICEGGGSPGSYDYLGCLLTDDGGLGLDFHIPWLREASAMCRRVMDGVSESECFTTECFAADISADIVWIAFNTEVPSSGAKFLLVGFAHVLDRWIDFLEAGVQRDGVRVEIQTDF